MMFRAHRPGGTGQGTGVVPMPTDPRAPAAPDSVVREASGDARRTARKPERPGIAPRPPASAEAGGAAPRDGGELTMVKPLYINSLF
jgi:hypothetical protein